MEDAVLKDNFMRLLRDYDHIEIHENFAGTGNAARLHSYLWNFYTETETWGIIICLQFARSVSFAIFLAHFVCSKSFCLNKQHLAKRAEREFLSIRGGFCKPKNESCYCHRSPVSLWKLMFEVWSLKDDDDNDISLKNWHFIAKCSYMVPFQAARALKQQFDALKTCLARIQSSPSSASAAYRLIEVWSEGLKYYWRLGLGLNLKAFCHTHPWTVDCGHCQSKSSSKINQK